MTIPMMILMMYPKDWEPWDLGGRLIESALSGPSFVFK